MNIVVLSFLIQLSIGSLAMDHAASHGDGHPFDIIDESWLVGMAHSIKAAF